MRKGDARAAVLCTWTQEGLEGLLVSWTTQRRSRPQGLCQRVQTTLPYDFDIKLCGCLATTTKKRGQGDVVLAGYTHKPLTVKT